MKWLVTVFPAHAGMSPVSDVAHNRAFCFPRTRGDEPVLKIVDGDAYTFSPHTRG